MIDKRMMYAMGQRVTKTLNGSRPGYAGPAGGASAGGNYGGNSSGGVGANEMSGAGSGIDRGFQNALDAASKRQAEIKASQDPDYGQFFGNRVPTYEKPSFGQSFGQNLGNVASGVVDYIKGGGTIGMIARGLGSLFGPSVSSTGNVGPAGIKTDGTYGTVEDAIRASQRNERPADIGGNNNTYIPPLYAEDEIIEDVDEDGILSLEDIVLRFQGKDRTLDPAAAGVANTDELRAMIQERVKNLYT